MISWVVPVSPSPRKDIPDAVVVSLGTHVGHGVEGEGDIETRLIGLACRGLDAGSRRNARDHHLGDVPRFQQGFEIRAGEGAPGPLRHHDVPGLLVQLRNEVGPSFRTGARLTRLFRPAWRTAGDVDEHHRPVALAESVGERPSPLDDVADRVDGGKTDDALLQVDDDQGRIRIERGQRHEFSSRNLRRVRSGVSPANFC